MKTRLLAAGVVLAAAVGGVVWVGPAIGQPGSGDNIGTPVDHSDTPLVRPPTSNDNTGVDQAKPGPLHRPAQTHENTR